MLRVCGPILKNGLTTGPAQNRTATRMGQGFECNSQHNGHASVTTTLDTYSHVLPHLQQRATEKLRFLLGSEFGSNKDIEGPDGPSANQNQR